MSGERRQGHSKLIYDKTKRTIVTVDPNPGAAMSGDELARILTKEQIAWLRKRLIEVLGKSEMTNALCDMALRAESLAARLATIQEIVDESAKDESWRYAPIRAILRKGQVT